MNESKRTSQVLKRFRELYPDGIAWKFNDRIARSRPDTFFARNDRVKIVEWKMPKGTLTPGQALEMDKLIGVFPRRVFVGFFCEGRQYVLCDYMTRTMQRFDGLDALCHFLA